MNKVIIVNEMGLAVRFSGLNAFECTPDDDKEFTPGQPYIGTGGNFKCKLAQSEDWVTFANVNDGSFLPIEVKAVHTDTDAEDILIIR